MRLIPENFLLYQKLEPPKYEQLLINFIIDNPEVDKKKIFMIDQNRIMTDLFWKGLEDIKASERKLGMIRERLESNLKLKVHLPFELVCFAVYRFEFCGLGEDDCHTWSFENVLVVYDHTTKFVIYRAKLTGELADFKTAVRVLIEGELKIPKLILVDPQLSGYVDECGHLINTLGLAIQICPCSNFRLSHFFNFYVTRRDMFIKYMIVPDKERRANTYVVDTPKDVTYQECLDRFLELAFDEFNTYDDMGSSDPAFRATPSYCFWNMRKGFSKEISLGEFALVYYDRVEAITDLKTCRAKMGTYVMDFKLASEYNGKTTLLIDTNKLDGDGFVVTRSRTLIKAKYQDRFILENGTWDADVGCAPLTILDVGDESNRLLREELGIPNVEESVVQLEKSRVLRKNYKRVKTESQ